jgi:hypothetical protein
MPISILDYFDYKNREIILNLAMMSLRGNGKVGNIQSDSRSIVHGEMPNLQPPKVPLKII